MSESEIFQVGAFEHNKSFQINNQNLNNNTLKRVKNIRFQNSYKNVSKPRTNLDARRRSSYFTHYSGHPQRKITESETLEYSSYVSIKSKFLFNSYFNFCISIINSFLLNLIA